VKSPGAELIKIGNAQKESDDRGNGKIWSVLDWLEIDEFIKWREGGTHLGHYSSSFTQANILPSSNIFKQNLASKCPIPLRN
jgi:hypothetical protein